MNILKGKTLFILQFLILIFISCGKKSEKLNNSKQLECILDKFIEISKIKKSNNILIGALNGKKNGLETNEILVTIEDIEDHQPSSFYSNLYESNYNGYTIYFSFDFLEELKIEPNNSLIPNSLHWKKKHVEKKATKNNNDSDLFVDPFYDYIETHIRYNNKTKNIITFRGVKGELLKIDCL